MCSVCSHGCLGICRKQVGELNIERETLRLSVSRMVEDKDKMATEVDLHHNELHEQTRHLLMLVTPPLCVLLWT